MAMMKSQEELLELYNVITKNKGKPLNHWEITALLETYGLRDIDAKNEFGVENLFELSKYLLKFIDNRDDYKLHSIQTIQEGNIYKRAILNYMRGLAFSVPMLVQIIFTLAVGYALWSSMVADNAHATAISLGTFAALIITGGSAQAIGRKGLFYLKMGEKTLARNVTFVLYIVGIVLIILLFIFLSITNFFFNIYPMNMYVIAMSYYGLLALFFLTLSIFYIFEDYISILLLTLSGLFFVYIFRSVLEFDLESAQIYGLIMLNILVIVVASIRVARLKDKNGSAEGSQLPKPSILFYSLLPYYTYGFFYFSFLVVDRIIAWSADVVNNPYVIWFNVRYELGLDWALISLVLMMGITEVSISEFMYRLNDKVVKISFLKAEEFSKEIYIFFKKFNIAFTLFSLVITIVTFLFVYGLHVSLKIEFIENFMVQPTISIFIIASIAYFLLVNSLMNILLMFSLSRHHIPVKAVGYGLFVNIFVGMILSRAFGYEYAVIGLLLGAFVLWIITFREIMAMFKNLDYFYYSAY
jgi:hypothetical protein